MKRTSRRALELQIHHLQQDLKTAAMHKKELSENLQQISDRAHRANQVAEQWEKRCRGLAEGLVLMSKADIVLQVTDILIPSAAAKHHTAVSKADTTNG